MSAVRAPFLGRIALLALANGLLWASIVPPWQAPDEPKHMEFIRLIRAGEAVVLQPGAASPDPALQAQIVASMDAHYFWWYGRAPGYDPQASSQGFSDLWAMGAGSALARTSPVYHWLLAQFQPADLLTGLYVGRLVSVALGVLIVVLAGLSARELWPSDPFVRYGAPLVLALHPMFAFAHAGVNNDVLVNALGALAFLLIVRLLARGGSWARIVLLAVVLAAAVAVKRVAVVLLPAALLALVAWRVVRSRRPARAAALWSAGMAGLVLALGAWWFGTGVGLLPVQWRWNLGQYFFNDPEQLGRIGSYLRAPGVAAVLGEYAWRVHQGFWGSFGWGLLQYTPWVYVLLAGLGALAALGALRRMFDRTERGAARAGLAVAATALAAAGGAAVLFFLGYMDQSYPVPPQGRYLFVAAVPAALLLTAGWGAWLPERLHARALTVLVLIMAAFDLLALAGVAAWFYA